jgi:hypothetical protein
MGITKAIRNCFAQAEKRQWWYTFWAFDIHSTILKPSYKLNTVTTVFYPHARQVMQHISSRPDISLMLYTCSHPHEIAQYTDFFAANDIHFQHVNENSEVVGSPTTLGCYDKKPYYNVLFEDKAGFDAETDWQRVHELLRSEFPFEHHQQRERQQQVKQQQHHQSPHHDNHHHQHQQHHHRQHHLIPGKWPGAEVPPLGPLLWDDDDSTHHRGGG